MVMMFRGIRGATTVESDTRESILEATKELLIEMLARNQAVKSDVISAFFTATSDLHAEFPARAARELGWTDVPMLCAVEMDVSGSVERCIRVLLHITHESQRGGKYDDKDDKYDTKHNIKHDALKDTVRHVYLRGAEELRPDL